MIIVNSSSDNGSLKTAKVDRGYDGTIFIKQYKIFRYSLLPAYFSPTGKVVVP
jgi:hypothetical protein